MKNLIAFAASLALNLAVLGSLNVDLSRTQAAPAGEVTVVQLPEGQLVADATVRTHGEAML